jgi:hypothetical protein
MYTADMIKVHSWPDLEDLSDGRWQRTWAIQFLADVPDQEGLDGLALRIRQNLVAFMEGNHDGQAVAPDLAVCLCRHSPREIQARLSARYDAWADEWFPAAWHMFEQIDQHLGPIDTIEGQPRDNWPPWNLRRYHTNGN